MDLDKLLATLKITPDMLAEQAGKQIAGTIAKKAKEYGTPVAISIRATPGDLLCQFLKVEGKVRTPAETTTFDEIILPPAINSAPAKMMMKVMKIEPGSLLENARRDISQKLIAEDGNILVIIPPEMNNIVIGVFSNRTGAMITKLTIQEILQHVYSKKV